MYVILLQQSTNLRACTDSSYTNQPIWERVRTPHTPINQFESVYVLLDLRQINQEKRRLVYYFNFNVEVACELSIVLR